MHRTSFGLAISFAVGAVLLLAPAPTEGQRPSRLERQTVNGREVVAREVLVKFRHGIQPADLADIAAATDAQDVSRIGRAGTLRLRSKSLSAAALIERLARRDDVVYAEPNFIIHITATPNDPYFPELWGLDNIHATPAWDLSLGSSSNVVAVIDTGIDYAHEDLAANMWSAPAEFTVSVDGQAITCAAGTHGFNAITRTCNPMDDQNHGTHVSGTIGAVGNNGIGVVGVNWTARLMAIKFLDAQGSGTTADAIAAVEFAIAVKQVFAATGGANIRVLSNSWGGPEFSQALLDQVNAANDADMLFVAGAGNDGFDNDILPFYPASFDAPNVISVASTGYTDDISWFSNYG
ncbi:MAG TPA: S8 family serine peptidase, partial [Vicinamibacterales bacterium]